MLSTARVRLRPWRAEDKASLLRYANNRNVSIHLRDRFPYPYTENDADFWLAFANQGTPLLHFAIEADGHAVGGIGLVLGEDIYRRSAEIGYWLGEPYWGRGLMTDAVRLMTEYAFRELPLVRLFAGVFETNPASARVLAKAGYELESRQRKSVCKDGRVLDQLLYVMVR